MESIDTQVDASHDADPFNLERFIRPQGMLYDTALSEIKNGKKRMHWMWFIFPQIAGLGYSPISVFYAIKSREEAQAYLHHPILGARLLECSEAALAIPQLSATEIFGDPDDTKLRSCATLFAAVPDAPPVFMDILARYFHGEPDGETLQLLKPDADK